MPIADFTPGILTDRVRILARPNGMPLQLDTNEYGELRIIQRTTLFDLKQVDLAPNGDLVTSFTANGGGSAYSYLKSGTILSTDTSADAISVLQTRQRPNYQSAKRHLIGMTAGNPAPAPGAFAEIGAFDDNDGVFWRRDGAGDDFFVLRSSVSGSPVDRVFPRSSWSDPLDGAGYSGVNLRPGDSPIWFAAYSWFGVADIGFGFILDGKPNFCHFVVNKDQTAPYMRTPNLPLRWQLYNGAGGASAGSELLASCGTVESEGAPETGALGLPGAIESGEQSLGVGTHSSVLALRLKDNVDRTVIPLSAEISAGINDEGTVQLLFNPTLTGTLVWSDAGGGVEMSETILPVVAEGRKLSASRYTKASRSTSAGNNSALALGRDYDGTSDIVVLAVKAGGAQDVRGFIEYREVP